MGRRGYEVQRGKLFRIARVNVLTTPYLYKLFNMRSEKELYGWYYGNELAKGDLSDLKVEKVIKEREKKTPSGKKLIQGVRSISPHRKTGTEPPRYLRK